MSYLLDYRATALDRDRKNQGQARQVAPAGTMPGGQGRYDKKGHIPVRIEPFQLERWMTKYEVNVTWDIAESGIYPMSIREILDLLPTEERESELNRLLDLRLGYSEACGSAVLRGLLTATYENTSP